MLNKFAHRGESAIVFWVKMFLFQSFAIKPKWWRIGIIVILFAILFALPGLLIAASERAYAQNQSEGLNPQHVNGDKIAPDTNKIFNNSEPITQNNPLVLLPSSNTTFSSSNHFPRSR